MELEIYQAETARIAAKQAANLEDARQILASGRPLSRLEFSGLHTLMVTNKSRTCRPVTLRAVAGSTSAAHSRIVPVAE